MGSINDRILELMKNEKIKQVEFANRIGVSQSYMSKLFKSDTGSKPSDRLIRIICDEFNVNEEWLRFGTGEMYNQINEDTLNKLIKEYNLREADKRILKTYLSLNESNRDAFQKFLEVLATNMANDDTVNNTDETSATVEKKIEKKVELYRNELILSQKGAI